MAYTIVTSTLQLGEIERPTRWFAQVWRAGKLLNESFGLSFAQAHNAAEAWARADAERRNEPFKYEGYGED